MTTEEIYNLKNPFQTEYELFEIIKFELIKSRNQYNQLKREIFFTYIPDFKVSLNVLECCKFSEFKGKLHLYYENEGTQVRMLIEEFPNYCLSNNIKNE